MILDPERSWAVLIGASEYAEDGPDARPALATGVQALADLFTDPGIWGLPTEQCLTLTGAEATQKQIRAALRTAAENADAALVVYYAGHGMQRRSGTRHDLYLAAHDSPADDELEWLPYGYVKGRFEKTRALRRILILDCCYSGHAAEYGPLGASDPDPESLELADASALLTASAQTQRAWVRKDAAMSVFTGALHQVLTDGLADAGEFLTLGVIAEQVGRRVPSGGDPQRIFKGGAEGLVLVRNSAHGASVADRRLLQERLRFLHGMTLGYLSMAPWWARLGQIIRRASRAYNALVHTNIFRSSLADDIATFKDVADGLDQTLRVVLRGGVDSDLGAIAATVQNLDRIQTAIDARAGTTKKLGILQSKLQREGNDLLISYRNHYTRLLGSAEQLPEQTLTALATAVPPNMRTWHGSHPTEAQVLPAVIRLLRRYGFQVDDYAPPS